MSSIELKEAEKKGGKKRKRDDQSDADDDEEEEDEEDEDDDEDEKRNGPKGKGPKGNFQRERIRTFLKEEGVFRKEMKSQKKVLRAFFLPFPLDFSKPKKAVKSMMGSVFSLPLPTWPPLF